MEDTLIRNVSLYGYTVLEINKLLPLVDLGALFVKPIVHAPLNFSRIGSVIVR